MLCFALVTLATVNVTILRMSAVLKSSCSTRLLEFVLEG